MQRVFIVFIVMLAGSLCRDQITFIQGPMNVTVSEGMDAYFPCSYNGTNRSPTWKINNHTYFINNLPMKTSYNGSVLTVSNVDLSLNNTSYYCYITILKRGNVKKIESDIGILLVSANTSSSFLYPKLSPSSVYRVPTTHHSIEESTIVVQPTITTSFDPPDSVRFVVVGMGVVAVIVAVVVVVVAVMVFQKRKIQYYSVTDRTTKCKHPLIAVNETHSKDQDEATCMQTPINEGQSEETPQKKMQSTLRGRHNTNSGQ